MSRWVASCRSLVKVSTLGLNYAGLRLATLAMRDPRGLSKKNVLKTASLDAIHHIAAATTKEVAISGQKLRTIGEHRRAHRSCH